MHQLKLLNLSYKYNSEDDIWYKESLKGKVELSIFTCEISYTLEINSQSIDGSFEYEEFDEAMALIENILKV